MKSIEVSFMKVIKTTNAPGAAALIPKPSKSTILFSLSVKSLKTWLLAKWPKQIEAQAHQALKNAQAVINASGAKWENVIKTTVFITNIDDFAKVMKLGCHLLYTTISCSLLCRSKKITKRCLD